MNRQITNFHYKTALVIQAIRAIGAENINLGIVEKIASKLKTEEKKLMLNEARIVPSWIYEIIREICRR